MQDDSKNVSRRLFLQGTAAGGVLSLLGTSGCAQLRDPPSNDPEAPSGDVINRQTLSVPGPMLPPVPAVLLSVNGKSGDPDEISVVWSFVLNFPPPQIGISVGDGHIAGKLVDLHKEFVLNIPTASIVGPFDIVDMNSGKVQDKFELSGLTRGKAIKINAPTVEESPIQLECRVQQTFRVPPVRTLFVAEVVAATVHPGVCDENGRLNVPSVSFFGMTAGSGEFYTMGECVGHIGQSIGRTDIKY